ncbi:MAG: hypothetical protein ACR2JE_02305, partial [Acidobacteriaceae bacterium]
ANPFVMTLTEFQVNAASPIGITKNDCIVVKQDGHFHLGRRRQELPSDRATPHVYESSLSELQLSKLRRILESFSVRSMAPFAQKDSPLDIAWYRGLLVKIFRDTGVQEAGYATWTPGEGTPDTTPNNIPIRTKQAWQISERVLQPLVDWFHGVEQMRLQSSRAEGTLCSVEPGH